MGAEISLLISNKNSKKGMIIDCEFYNTKTTKQGEKGKNTPPQKNIKSLIIE